ncbi:uncharacterized protein BJ212DRAFT_1308246 [Suillus subaureus]|uniref:Uncharacterized protein n=1 Tax=Suillus subaureus TaxID=48587 RepID=A0A9P7JK29_9AGAM|nr:uncharacterized protein BJ212DRAFT_1308246 [Suillus subaureus]KAG1826784.1 hypothetical protein BJ212DRAFT_1308246 [Suillus subaureus]
MALHSSSFQENRPAGVPEAAPRLSGITKQNLSDQPVHEYDEYKARQGSRSKPSISLESSVDGAALSRTNEYASLPSRRPKSSSADAFMYMSDNPFADAAPSGNTPSFATREDPMHDIMRYSHIVTAEHKPRVACVSGINGAWPERAEIVNPSRGFPGPTIPRGTFSQAKAFFLKLSASGGYLQVSILIWLQAQLT